MGERKNRAKSFQQSTSKVLATELEQAGLFSGGPVDIEYLIECYKEADIDLPLGSTVRLVDLRDGIDVFYGALRIGYVLTSQVNEIRQIYLLPTRSNRAMKGKICEISELSSAFSVVVKE